MGVGRKREIKEPLDFVINDAVTLSYSLVNIYRPIIEEGEQTKIKEVREHFKLLTEFFLNPSKQKINEIVGGLVLPSDFIENLFARDNKQKIDFLKSRPILKYCIIVLGSTFLTGFVSFLVLLPYANNEPLIALNSTIPIAGVATAASVGVSFLDSKRSTQ